MIVLTIIVPCHNEAEIITAKIENCRQLQMNNMAVELLIVDDYSEDDTVALAEAAGARVIRSEAPRGKANATAYAVNRSRGRIVCITDADAMIDAGAMLPAMELFDDPKVGAVSGLRRMIRMNSRNEPVAADDLYDKVRRVMMLTYSRIDSTPTLHGPMMLIRRELAERVKCTLPADDIDLPMQIRRMGYKCLICKHSWFSEIEPAETAKEVQLKRRALGMVQAYWHYRSALFDRSLGAFGLLVFPAEFFFYFLTPFILLYLVPAVVAVSFLDDIVMMLLAKGVFAHCFAGGPCLNVTLDAITAAILSFVLTPNTDDMIGIICLLVMGVDFIGERATGTPGVRGKMVQMVQAMRYYASNRNSLEMAWHPPLRKPQK
jgi:poly-beta-1,6-N-acetyl-D-glucosamine synthase